MKKIIIILCLILILSVGQLPIAVSTTQSVTLIPIADTYIDVGELNTNFGASNYLKVWGEVQYSSSSFGYKSYLKFDLSDIPSSATIVTAELETYLYRKNSETCTISAHYCSNNNWDEIYLTWNNAPIYESTSIDTCYGIAFEGWYSWTIISAVKRSLSQGLLTLVLEEIGHNDISSFHSKDRYYSWDEDTRPKLIITYSGVETNEQPDARFTYYPSSPTTDDTIQFTDESTDLDGTIASWKWVFGDGYESSKQNPQHKYITSGTYSINLEIADDDGSTDSYSKTITVQEPSIEETPDEDDINDNEDIIKGDGNDDDVGDDSETPGFGLVISICAIAMLIIWKHRRNKDNN